MTGKIYRCINWTDTPLGLIDAQGFVMVFDYNTNWRHHYFISPHISKVFTATCVTGSWIANTTPSGSVWNCTNGFITEFDSQVKFHSYKTDGINTSLDIQWLDVEKNAYSLIIRDYDNLIQLNKKEASSSTWKVIFRCATASQVDAINKKLAPMVVRDSDNAMTWNSSITCTDLFIGSDKRAVKTNANITINDNESSEVQLYVNDVYKGNIATADKRPCLAENSHQIDFYWEEYGTNKYGLFVLIDNGSTTGKLGPIVSTTK